MSPGPIRRHVDEALRRLFSLGAFIVTHQVPAGGDPVPPGRGDAPSTVAIVSSHRIPGGFGDQVVALVERVLERRAEVVGPLPVLDPRVPVVLVICAARRGRSGFDLPPGLAGRRVAVVIYGSGPAQQSETLDAVRRELMTADAEPIELTAVFDTARLRPTGATSRPVSTAPGTSTHDHFGLQTLELVLDDLRLPGVAGPDGPFRDRRGPDCRSRPPGGRGPSPTE